MNSYLHIRSVVITVKDMRTKHSSDKNCYENDKTSKLILVSTKFTDCHSAHQYGIYHFKVNYSCVKSGKHFLGQNKLTYGS